MKESHPGRDRAAGPENADALRASVSARVERLRVALADAGLTDPSQALAMAGVRTPVGAPAPRGSVKFLARADSFLAAMEIALPIRVSQEQDRDLHLTLEALAQRVEYIGSGSVHTLAQLRHLEEAFLTFWNEGSRTETHTFWEQVQAAGLPYQRVDHLGKILARGRIASRTEYEFAVDSVVVAEQDGRLNREEAARLAEMIGTYERRRR